MKVRQRLGASERRACRVLGQARSTQRRRPKVKVDEEALREDVVNLARRFGRYGYRRVTGMLKAEGWREETDLNEGEAMYPRTLRWLYVLNLGFLATHEIDSAYWHEWELFLLPGGIQLFLILNLLLLLVFLAGLVELVMEQRRGFWFSLGLSAVGVFAFGIHSVFLALGHPEFRLPVSLGILLTAFALSLIQGWVTLRALPRASRVGPNDPT